MWLYHFEPETKKQLTEWYQVNLLQKKKLKAALSATFWGMEGIILVHHLLRGVHANTAKLHARLQ